LESAISLFISFSYAAFTLNGFDDQERNLMLVKTDFQVLKFKFYTCIMKQAFYLLHKQNVARRGGSSMGAAAPPILPPQKINK